MSIARIIEGRNAADIITCDVEMTVRQAVNLLAGRRIGAMPVMEQGQVAGVFSERDVIYRLDSNGPGILETRVGDVMTAPAVTVSSDSSIDEALSMMTKRRIRHLPVVDQGRMIGIVSIGDLVKYRIDAIESEAAAMRDYIRTA
ncbi:inosine-5-monophosphate dehydrogenase [Novosphingobium marinum]|uniref:CBS domain-containing protein n=1 Tax=Novosphingobium marinum TaxID=1514948 RepID=A0A7Z0BTY4_9SPHN|nr:CBS domain-containing protein [Novosphingobium marinum]NYH95629.1 CBS domain-containing protein [Novosphingobium marinum]GGC28564.1 inosine-5-monophosphate dehydrogenase [Novosphingobium marinum]